MTEKKILITGASGFIGGFLVEEALNNGFEVTAAVRPTSDKSYLQDPRIRFIELNLKSEETMIRQLTEAGRFHYVIHNAGSTKALDFEAFRENNVENTKRLVNALNRPDLLPEKFLYVSSLAATGPAQDGIRIQRNHPPKPVTSYGESKLMAERFLESQLGFPWVVIQPTAVFGPREKDIFTFIKMVNAGLEIYIGAEDQKLSFIYVKDLASVMIAILKVGQIGEKYHISDENIYSNDDLGNSVKRVLGKKTIKFRIPLPLIRVVAYASEKVGKWRGAIPTINREKMNELTAQSWLCEAPYTFNSLHIKPKYDLYSGMEEAINWYKENKWIK